MCVNLLSAPIEGISDSYQLVQNDFLVNFHTRFYARFQEYYANRTQID